MENLRKGLALIAASMKTSKELVEHLKADIVKFEAEPTVNNLAKIAALGDIISGKVEMLLSEEKSLTDEA